MAGVSRRAFLRWSGRAGTAAALAPLGLLTRRAERLEEVRPPGDDGHKDDHAAMVRQLNALIRLARERGWG
jgi:hypothetical protein